MGVRSSWLTASEIRGAKAVAEQFGGAAQAVQLALIDGVPGAVRAPKGTQRLMFGFTIRNDTVVEIELTADIERLSLLKIEMLPWRLFGSDRYGQCGEAGGHRAWAVRPLRRAELGRVMG